MYSKKANHRVLKDQFDSDRPLSLEIVNRSSSRFRVYFCSSFKMIIH